MYFYAINKISSHFRWKSVTIVSNQKKISCFSSYTSALVSPSESLLKVTSSLKTAKAAPSVGDVCAKPTAWRVGHLPYFCCLKKTMTPWPCMLGASGFSVEDITTPWKCTLMNLWSLKSWRGLGVLFVLLNVYQFLLDHPYHVSQHVNDPLSLYIVLIVFNSHHGNLKSTRIINIHSNLHHVSQRQPT